MKNSKTNKKDTFQEQLTTYKKLLVGAKMAKLSSVALIGFSLAHTYNSRENILVAMSLLIGALGLVFFINNFLSTKDFKQKSYSKTSLIASISKFKNYMSIRKKYEMYFISFWALTLIPYAAIYLGSNVLGIIGILSALVLVGFLGELAFRKVDKIIALLETTMKNELQQQ